jgi:plasmid stabilization system protein ParE
MRCKFSGQAEIDLEAIGDYIAQDNPVRAESFVDELCEYCRNLAKPPEFRRVIGNFEGRPLRKALFGNYQVYYVPLLDEDDGIEIVHIRHGARRTVNFN